MWYHIELDLTEKEKSKLRNYCLKSFGLWMCKTNSQKEASKK